MNTSTRGFDTKNRLAAERSPYLQQHAANPVDWYPWGDEAFEKARREDKPVFLSIGYSACHWCHVMERESFENPEIAEVLNRHFVSVKVDREERPDLDHAYMAATQAMKGAGGWPLSVFLTGDRKPFFAGTYFPPRDVPGRMGFLSVVRGVARAWNERRPELLEQADKVVDVFREDPPGSRSMPDEDTLREAVGEFAGRFDPLYGGFSSGTKFPMGHALMFLLRYWYRTGSDEVLRIVTFTLDQMAFGGVYDHLGGGFHRYSTERTWLVPHFEKMLYDQALLVQAYAEAYEVTGNPEYRRIVAETLAYVSGYMGHPEGGFYAAEDADSEGEEGKFYLWTKDEILDVLGETDGELFCRFYGVTDEGILEHKNVLAVSTPVAEFAAQEGIDVRALIPGLDACRAKLLQRRDTRVRPLRDDKILTDWNGLMISALSKASRALHEPAYARAAVRAAEFVLKNIRRDDGRLLKRWFGGKAEGLGLLQDHAFLCNGLLDLYGATLEARWLAEAAGLARDMDRLFRDRSTGRFSVAPADGETLALNPGELHDGAIPSGNSAALLALTRLAHITGDRGIGEQVESAFKAFSSDIREAPSAFPFMLTALDYHLGPRREVVIALGEGGDGEGALIDEAFKGFRPRTVVLQHETGEAGRMLESVVPFVKNQTASGGKSALYVCEGYTCGLPTTEVNTAKKMLLQGQRSVEG